MVKRLAIGSLFLSFLILISSCSAIKTAKRKSRKAHKLLEQAGQLAPSIMDTVWVIERDTITLTEDSIVFRNQIVIDSTAVDSLILELIGLKANGEPEKIKHIKELIYKELIPDTTFHSVDTLTITIDEEKQNIRFSADIILKDGMMSVSIKPVDDIAYVSKTAEVSIDARKMGRWWKGFQWGGLSMLLILVALWFFRGIIGTTLKRYLG